MAQVVVTTAVWGFGFVAIKWTLAAVSPIWMTVYRLIAVVLIAAPLIFAIPAWRKSVSRGQIKLAFWPGTILASFLVLQTWGAQHTTVTNASFITTLYVVIVPLLAARLLRTKVSAMHWGLVALALAGTALICKWNALAFNFGDLLVFFSAFGAAVHMLVIERIVPQVQSAVVFNVLQSLWAVPIALLCALLFEPLVMPVFTTQALGAFLVLVIFCSLVGFAVQVEAQKVLPAVFISVLFLLESPFAALFGAMLLGERLDVTQWAGAALILISSAGVCVLASRS